MAELSFRNVRKNYGDLEVIHGVSMDVTDGEFVVIVGPSGCGKSTLLRMVAGLEPITSGEIVIGGRVVNELEPKDRDIAMVFQNYALYPHMTVYDNMSYGLRIRGFTKPDIESRVQKAAAILQYRTEHGAFQSVDDLDNVPGIGPATLANIRALVSVGATTSETVGHLIRKSKRFGNVQPAPKPKYQAPPKAALEAKPEKAPENAVEKTES